MAIWLLCVATVQAANAAEPQWKRPGVGASAKRGDRTSHAIVSHLSQAADAEDESEAESTEDLPTPTPAAPRTAPAQLPRQSPQWVPNRESSGPPPADYGQLSGQFEPVPDDAEMAYDDYAGGGEFATGGPGMGGFRPVRNAWQRFNAKHNVPLAGESWRYRPFSASVFIGGHFGDDLLDRTVSQRAAALIGGRAGWDMSAYVGGELRMWYANPAATFRPITADQLEAHLFGLDFDVLYYPWGETRLRPYLMAGLGFVDVVYHDAPTTKVDDMMLGLPFGIGFKYRLDNRFVLRTEFIDNYSFPGSRTDEMHNLSVTMGLEARFGGGDRRSYYPWNPRYSTW